MITTLADLANASLRTLRTDVAVVGAGFAGIDLARQLAGRGVRVVLLESGGVTFDPRTQALAKVDSIGKPTRVPDPQGPFTPYLAPEYRGEARLRQLGGTSNIWTGKWRRFDALDFQPRPWIAHSGWPLDLDQLRGHYDAVARDYGLADFDGFARSAAYEQLRASIQPGLTTSFHYWARRPLRLTSRSMLRILEGDSSIQVVLGANATALVGTDARVDCVQARALDGGALTVHADSFVLACGGVEVPRLLLASGIGNDLVGRFFMDHPKHKRGTLRPGPAFAALVGDLAETWPRPRFHVSFSLSEEVQRSMRLPNHALYFSPEGEEAAATVGERLRRRLGVPRRSARAEHYALSMYVEQAPNRASRVLLADAHDENDTDGVGMRRAVVDWRLTDFDRAAFPTLLRLLAEECARTGMGGLDFDAVTIDDTVDAAHHMGTARMATTPAEGVVDGDCKVFGTSNLYVASTAVFPTGHSAAPTFTMLALARRLADHLVGRT